MSDRQLENPTRIWKNSCRGAPGRDKQYRKKLIQNQTRSKCSKKIISQMCLSMTKFAEDLLRRFSLRIDNDIKWKFRGVGFSSPSRKYLKSGRGVFKKIPAAKNVNSSWAFLLTLEFIPRSELHCLAFLKGRKFLSEIFELLNLADKHFLCWRKIGKE